MRSFLWIWSHLLKKSLIENLIFVQFMTELSVNFTSQNTVISPNFLVCKFCKKA